MARMLRRGLERWTAAALLTAIVLALPAAARAASGPTPFLDCVAAENGAFIAYFGYVNTSPAITVAVGADNMVVPGISFQGQPSYFQTGTYLRAFSVAFGTVFPEVGWELNGVEAVATGSSPPCDDAVTGTASVLTPTTATLNGVVTPDGESTTYTFSWGTSTPYTQQSQPVTVTGNAPQLVSDPITGLLPGTTYHFALQASNADDGASAGADQTFTTPVAVTPPVDLSLTNASSAASIAAGGALTYTLTATDLSTTTAATGVTVTDPLPGALRVTGTTASQGSCSGSATVVCAVGQLAPGATATVTIAGTAQGDQALVNTASVSGDQPDPDAANNIATATTTVSYSALSLTWIGVPSGQGGRVRATVACVGQAGDCDVVAVLSTREIRVRGRVQAVTATASSKGSVPVTVGSLEDRVAAGGRLTLTITLNGAGRRLLTRFGRLPVRLRVGLTGNGGHAATLTRTVVVMASGGLVGSHGAAR